jgi:hypothetical protein
MFADSKSICSSLDYEAILAKAHMLSTEVVPFLLEELRHVWRDCYLQMTKRETNIIVWRHGGFEYIYDDYASLESNGVVPYHPTAEARLVAALGFSEPRVTRRDDC